MIHFGRTLEQLDSEVEPVAIGGNREKAVRFFEAMKDLDNIDEVELLFQEVLTFGIRLGQANPSTTYNTQEP